MYFHECTCHGVEVRGGPGGVTSLLPHLLDSEEPTQVTRLVQQAPLPTEPFYHPSHSFILRYGHMCPRWP